MTQQLRAVALLTSLTLALSGCAATADKLVGLHPAPVENLSGAPLDPAGARVVAARAVDAAWAAVATKGAAGTAAEKAALTGAALDIAQAARTVGQTRPAPAPLTTQADLTVAGISAGHDWPRSLLVADLDPRTDVQYLHVLVSRSASAPYRVSATVPMLGGARLPSLGDLATGMKLAPSSDGKGAILSPDAAVAAYAGQVAQPAPKKKDSRISLDDDFAAGLRSSYAAQAKALGKLATLRVTHEPVKDRAVAWVTPDGGRVVFALLRRTETITVSPKAKELRLPKPYSTLAKKDKATKQVTVTSLEPVVLLVPPSGKVTLVGADEQLEAVKAT